MRTLTCLLAIVLLGAVPHTTAAQDRAVTYAGRALADVLREMQRDGVRIVYSSELVQADMRVVAEPKAKDPARAP